MEPYLAWPGSGPSQEAEVMRGRSKKRRYIVQPMRRAERRAARLGLDHQVRRARGRRWWLLDMYVNTCGGGGGGARCALGAIWRPRWVARC